MVGIIQEWSSEVRKRSTCVPGAPCATPESSSWEPSDQSWRAQDEAGMIHPGHCVCGQRLWAIFRAGAKRRSVRPNVCDAGGGMNMCSSNGRTCSNGPQRQQRRGRALAGAPQPPGARRHVSVLLRTPPGAARRWGRGGGLLRRPLRLPLSAGDRRHRPRGAHRGTRRCPAGGRCAVPPLR